MSADTTTTTPEDQVISWDNITPEQYEQHPLVGGWPWCAPNTWPQSYAWEAPCAATEPCVGGARLWTLVACDGAPVPAEPVTEHPVNAMVGQSAPAPSMMLPSTGLSIDIAIVATLFTIAGLALWFGSHRQRQIGRETT